MRALPRLLRLLVARECSPSLRWTPLICLLRVGEQLCQLCLGLSAAEEWIEGGWSNRIAFDVLEEKVVLIIHQVLKEALARWGLRASHGRRLLRHFEFALE